MNDQQQALCAELAFRDKRRAMAKDAGNEKHDPSNGQFTSGGGSSFGKSKPSKAWSEAVSNKNLKSYEVAGANAKELYRLRKEIDKAEQSGDKEKLGNLKSLYQHVEVTGKKAHEENENMPMTKAFGSK